MRTVLLMIIAISLSVGIAESAELSDKDATEILAPSDAVFKAMLSKDYVTVWGLLSETSRQTIVKDVCTALKRNTRICFESEITADLRSGGPIAKAHWGSYLGKFDPKTVLEQSQWEIGTVGKDNSEIKITYKGSGNAATLSMYKEDGIWKVGLAESFWSLK